MIEIIQNKASWDHTLKSVDIYDFYHTYEYHYINRSINEEPLLVKYTEGNTIIAIPFILRRIDDTSFYDLTSVYGYAGPITKGINHNFDNSTFVLEFKEYLLSKKIVSIFTRLNPFIPNQLICLKQYGKVSSTGNIVNIDLTLEPHNQLQRYHKRLRTHVNKARRLCNIKIAETKEEVLTFIDLYYKNMDRVNAKKHYYFKEKYFFDLLNSKDFKTNLYIASEKEFNKIIAGALFIRSNDIVHYHLSGADQEKLDHYPIKLLIDKMRIISSKEGYKFYNLGGGLGGKEDSLFHFKSGFSKDFKDFKTWKVIVDKKVYDQLVAIRQSRTCNLSHELCAKFFPCYRCIH